MRLSGQCFAAAVLAASLSSVAAAEVYRCTEGGKTVYSDRPCQGGAATIVAVPQRGTDQSAGNPQTQANMGRIVVGQTPLQVEMAWGSPKAKNIDTGSAGRVEQWVYERPDGTAYVYFHRGLVSSFSEHSEGSRSIRAEASAAPQPTRAEIENEERAAKAGERKFIRERGAMSDVRKRIGEPDSKTFAGLQECWYYAATRLDPQTNTTICSDGSGFVFSVDRRVSR